MTETNILLFGKGYWGKVWYNTLLKSGHRFSVVDPTFTQSEDENGIRTYRDVKEVFLKFFTHAIVATPANTHVDLFRTLVGELSPAHILIEKPCGTSFTEAEKLVGCYPGYLQLHTPAFEYIREHLGAIGQPHLYKSIRASMGPRVRTDCSIVEDYLVHDLYIFSALFGSALATTQVISKQTMRRLSYAGPDTIFLQLHSPDCHVLADMFSSWWYPIKERRVIITGTAGSFLWINDDLYFNESRYVHGAGTDNYGNYGDHLIVHPDKKIDLGTKTAVECELDNFLFQKNAVHMSDLLYRTWMLIRDIQYYSKFSY